MSELATLTILPVNKTVVFYSPIEGKDVLVRTGTVTEGSCFFHALLHAYSKNYVSMNNGERVKFVKKLRVSISSKIDKNQWESMSDGLVAKTPFQENVNTILSDFYRFISRADCYRVDYSRVNYSRADCRGRTKSVRKIIRELIKDEKSMMEAYKLVTEMVSVDKGFKKSILPSAYDKCNDSNLSECKKTIVQYAVKYYKKEFKKLKGNIDEESVSYYVGKLKLLIRAVVDEAENSAYTEYIKGLCDTPMEVDSYIIGLISDKFNRDIYFIDSSTRMPYINSRDNIRKRKSMIVMWTGGYHYEIVGRLLSGNRIQREFDFRDPLIEKFYTYLCKPERVPNKYPNLISYLSKDLREKLHIDVSDSEEDRMVNYSKSDSSCKSDDGKYVSSDDEYEKSGSDSSDFIVKDSSDYKEKDSSDYEEKFNQINLSKSDSESSDSD